MPDFTAGDSSLRVGKLICAVLVGIESMLYEFDLVQKVQMHVWPRL
jgi:hypothetical protein